MDEATIKNFIRAELQRMVGSPYQSRLDPSYAGGDIKTDDTLSGTAGSESSYSLMPATYRYPVASEPEIMLPFGAGKVAAGMMESLHLGLPAAGAYWFVPQMYPTVESTLATGGAAFRLPMPFPLYVTRAQIEVTTNQGGSSGTVKIYSSNGTLLWTSNALTTTSNNFITSTATSPGVWLNPGYFYIIEYTNTNAAVAVRAVPLSTTADNHLNETAAQRATSAANLVANTGTNAVDFPRIKLF